MAERLHIMLMGGTIDSFYDGTKDTAVPRRESIVPRYLKSIKMPYALSFSEICMKDSRDVAKTDLKKLVAEIKKSRSKKVIVTHGTYTMPESARFVKFNLKRKDQIIIFTGAMIPLDGFTMSDAGFNLGYSIAEMDVLEPGVYVCMNGQVFSPDEVVKLLKEGRFSSVFGEN